MKLKQLLTIRWTPNRLVFAVAATVYLLLATLPASRWLIRWQNTSGFCAQGETDPWRKQNLAEAAKHPDDFLMQFAAALQNSDGAAAEEGHKGRSEASRVWELRQSFPDKPAVYAAVVRYLMWQEIRLDRSEELGLLSPPMVRAKNAGERARKTPRKAATIDPKSLALFLEASSQGEKLDPENSFFPMMQATALFAIGADYKALAALHRAAEKPVWNDYASLEAVAGSHLTRAAHGETGALAETARLAAILYPHLAQYRATTQVAVALAVRRELAGDREGGWTIRYDVARCGAAMRNGSAVYIGSLLGCAMTQMAMTRPGGEEEETDAAPLHATGNDLSHLRTERFLAYAEKIGCTDKAAFFQSEAIAAEETKALYPLAEDESMFSLPRLTMMVALRALGSALISNVLVVLVLGAIAFGLAQTPRIRSGRPLPAAVRWGVAAVTLPVPFAIAFLLYGSKEETIPTLACLFAAVPMVASLNFLRGKERRRNFLAFLATLASGLAILGLVLLGAIPAFHIAKEIASALGIVDFGIAPACKMVIERGTNFGLEGMEWVVLPTFGGVLFVSTWVTSLALLARCRRVPVSVGIARGMAGSALTAASILLSIYAAVTVLALRVEGQRLAELGEITRHEGRYYARLAQRPWPKLPVGEPLLRK